MQTNKSKPNVIIINCDDLGYGDFSCYGNTVNHTPFIQEAAERGMVFTEAYAASSICSPSRAGFMTGCYPPRVGINRVLFPGEAYGLDNNEYTLPKLFKESGYTTKIIGKWHLGDQEVFMPSKFGFDEFYGLPYSNDMGRQVPSEGYEFNYPPLPLMRNELVIEEQPDQASLTERYTEEAVRYIYEHKENPFFLYLAHMHVHLPLYAGERFLKESENGRFGACVAETDWSCGVIMRTIQKLSLEQDTIIIIMSDNGSNGKNGASNAPLIGGKSTSFEGGFRIPFLMLWKDHIKENVINQNMISQIDLLPTFAHMLGKKIPSDYIDGLDISDTIFYDKPVRDEMAYFMNRRTDDVSMSKTNLDAVRKGDYKLYVKRTKGPYLKAELVNELYNIKVDPSESNNIYAKEPQIVKALQEVYLKYSTELGDYDSNVIGAKVRPCRTVKDPVPLTHYDPNESYYIAMYDLPDFG